ncbi:hypothetical protein D2B79_24260, partial [Salmonella enterica]|nr:hypothetical protein [Salmonella enterica]
MLQSMIYLNILPHRIANYFFNCFFSNFTSVIKNHSYNKNNNKVASKEFEYTFHIVIVNFHNITYNRTLKIAALIAP